LAFEGLRDQLKEQWADLSAKIQESPAFNSAREQFESQTPTVQRAIVAAGIGLAAFFLLSFPYGYLSSSSEYMSQFEENRSLIQGLLRASRSAKTPSPIPPPIEAENLKSRLSNLFTQNRLMPEQIGEMQTIPHPPVKGIPASVEQNGVAVQVKKLNLTQIIALGNQVQNIGPGTKLMGMDIVQSAGQTHYYDVILKVVNFGLPQIADAGPDEEPPARGKKPARPSQSDEEAPE
jgi:hypothetical protein